jgi:hypothetical protein
MTSLFNTLHKYAGIKIAVPLFVLVALFGVVGSASAQTTTDQALFRQAQQAYQQARWVDAAMLLKAYVERNPEQMVRDAQHRQAVRAALQYASEKARWAVQQLPVVEGQLSQCRGVGVAGLEVPPPTLSTPSSSEPTSYPLVCRGGGFLQFDFTSRSNVSAKPQLWITFDKASSGAGMNHENVGWLEPGQCTWLDRTVGTNEPDRIAIREPLFNLSDFGISWTSGQVSGIGSALSYLNVLQSADYLQTFQVYNDGQGNFIVTGIDNSAEYFPY